MIHSMWDNVALALRDKVKNTKRREIEVGESGSQDGRGSVFISSRKG